VRDLDDPANPYREQYGAWDRWILGNAKYPSMDEMSAYMNGSAPEGYVYLRPTVTPEGWLVPQLAELRQQFALQTDYTAYRNRASCTLSFSASGVAPLEVAQGLEQARLRLWADSLPHAPRWLADALPKRALLLPDGGAVTYGPLGSGVGAVDAASWRYDKDGNPEVYYRYGADGREVARTSPGQPWQELFRPGYTQDVLLAAAKQGMIPIVLNGYTILVAQGTGDPVSVYDYTGAELPPGEMQSVDKGRLVVEVEGDFLGKVIALQ